MLSLSKRSILGVDRAGRSAAFARASGAARRCADVNRTTPANDARTVKSIRWTLRVLVQ
jgi:hypothetical protein